MQYRLLPTKKAPEIPVLARFASPKPSLPVMFGPNITGEAGVTMSWGAGDPNGCLAFGSKKHDGASGSDTSGRYLVLDASKASSIFGNGSSVQPSSLRLLPCIKV